MPSVLPLLTSASAPRDPTEWVGPGLLGFVVIAGLCVATVLLWRNMNKQLRKVRFEEEPDPRSTRAAGGQGRAGGEHLAGAAKRADGEEWAAGEVRPPGEGSATDVARADGEGSATDEGSTTGEVRAAGERRAGGEGSETQRGN